MPRLKSRDYGTGAADMPTTGKFKPSERALRVAEAIIRNLCFNSYSYKDVARVARRIAKAYDADITALLRVDDGDPFNAGWNAGLSKMFDHDVGQEKR